MTRILGHPLNQDPLTVHPVQVRVEFPHKELLCSASKKEAPSRQIVVVPPNSSKMVPFLLLPLEIGKVDVEVRVVSIGVEDHIRKTLLVKVMGAPTSCYWCRLQGFPRATRL